MAIALNFFWIITSKKELNFGVHKQRLDDDFVEMARACALLSPKPSSSLCFYLKFTLK